MLRALIVDDEPPARARLRQLLDAAGGVSVVAEAGCALDARELVRAHAPDVLFLDIEMPEMRGTTLAASLPDPRPFVVFATAYEHYAIEAFACDATDYLLKPVNRAKLAATLDRVRQRLASRSDAERDVAVAARLQADMWPGAVPAIPGFDCAAASLPAAGVGGDVYDVFRLDDTRWSLLLGDVSGKGVPAGLVATALQGRVQTAARHAGLAPEPLCAAISDDLFASTQGQRYATLVYGELDTRARTLRLVNAGHGGIQLSSAGLTNPLPSTGPALGLFPDATFTSVDVNLGPGTDLVIYTDGVNEALDAQDEEFGHAKVALIGQRLRGHSAAEQAAALLAEVRAHRGVRQLQDDVTVMVIRSLR